MGSERPRRVTLSGDLAGDYVVVEERPDGSLVVAPESVRSAVRAAAARRPAPGGASSMLAGSAPRPPLDAAGRPRRSSRTGGSQLAEDEAISEFMIAEVDGRRAFSR